MKEENEGKPVDGASEVVHDVAVLPHGSAVTVAETEEQALALHAAAIRALEAATEFSQVRRCRTASIAAAAWAVEAKDFRMIKQATELQVRAERRAGEMLAEAAKTGDRMTPTTSRRTDLVDNADRVPTLTDIGVTRDQSSRWQMLASIPKEDFEVAVMATKEKSRTLTAGKIVAYADTHGSSEWMAERKRMRRAKAQSKKPGRTRTRSAKQSETSLQDDVVRTARQLARIVETCHEVDPDARVALSELVVSIHEVLRTGGAAE